MGVNLSLCSNYFQFYVYFPLASSSWFKTVSLGLNDILVSRSLKFGLAREPPKIGNLLKRDRLLGRLWGLTSTSAVGPSLLPSSTFSNSKLYCASMRSASTSAPVRFFRIDFYAGGISTFFYSRLLVRLSFVFLLGAGSFAWLFFSYWAATSSPSPAILPSYSFYCLSFFKRSTLLLMLN